jgi:hypothetical protein
MSNKFQYDKFETLLGVILYLGLFFLKMEAVYLSETLIQHPLDSSLHIQENGNLKPHSKPLSREDSFAITPLYPGRITSRMR